MQSLPTLSKPEDIQNMIKNSLHKKVMWVLKDSSELKYVPFHASAFYP